MINLQPNFTREDGGDNTAKKVILAQFDKVLTSYGKNNRSSKTLDGRVDSFWGGVARRVNKVREATAREEGRTTYIKCTAYDAMRGVYQGNAEFKVSEYEAQTLVNRLASMVGYKTYISTNDAIEIFNEATQRFAEHPDAQDYITLESLSAADLEDLGMEVEDDIPSADGEEILENVLQTTQANA